MGKDAKNVDDISSEDLDSMIREVKATDVANSSAPGSGSVVVNFLVAAAVTAIPIYLYISPMFNMDLEKDALYFGIVTLVAAVFLTLAYNKTAAREVRRLSALTSRKPRAPRSNKRKGGKSKGGDSEDDSGNDSSIVRAVSWAMFYNNLLFVAMFMLLAFNLIPTSVPAYINYIFGVTLPSVCVYALAWAL